MLRFAAIALALLTAAPAVALDQASVPTKFPIAWGNSAGVAYIRNIPQASQIGVQNCAASLTDGFPPLTFVPASAGGCPPFGQDMNGILRQLSQWSRWQGAGAVPLYDSSFSSSINGYPSGATLANATTPGCFWISTADNNASNPDAFGANWNSSCPGGGIGGTSGGSANVQTITTTPYVLRAGAVVSFVAGFSNTGQLTVNVNGGGGLVVYRFSQLGATPSVGGEVVAGQTVTLRSPDGLVWHCTSCASVVVGEMRDFIGTAPTGWFPIDGSCKSQTTYADLFAVASTTWGSCGGGLFAIPDGRGRLTAANDNPSGSAANRITTAGSGINGAANAAAGGNQTVTLARANLTPTLIIVDPNDPGHGHITNYDVAAVQAFVSGVQADVIGAAGIKPTGGTTSAGVNTNTTGVAPSFNLNGGVPQTAVNKMPPTIIVTKMIKY